MQVRPRLHQVERRWREVRTPGPRVDGIRRLVVVRDDRLGDLVVSAPAVCALRRAYPEARLALMVRRALAPVAWMIGGVDDVLDASHDTARVHERLAEYRPDMVVCISRGFRVPWGATRAGVTHRVGSGYRLYSPLFTRRVDERRRGGPRHELEYALSFAHRVGAASSDPGAALRTGDEAERAAADWLVAQGIDDRFVILHPGTGGSCPAWPVERYGELAARLRDCGIPVVLSVGPADGRAGASLDRDPQVRELPRFTGGLRTLPALLRRSAVVVSNSTGPLHLAAALGAPALGLYAPWPTCGVTRWGPYAANGWVLAAETAGAERWSRSRRLRDGPALMDAIPSELVADLASALFRGQTPRL